MTEMKLINDGSGGDTYVLFGEDVYRIMTQAKKNRDAPLADKIWTTEEVIALLNDGRKYRLLREAEKLKKDI